MKANELRIGNWVECRNKFIRVKSIYDQGINLELESGYYGGVVENYDGYFENEWFGGAVINPIPLIPEILEKCGFVKSKSDKDDNEDHYVYGNQVANNFSLYFDTDHWEIAQEWNDSRVYFYFWNHIKRLHQLQNLYFALTGEELNIEL